MSEYEFWQAVYVAVVRAGWASNAARLRADEALIDLRAAFPAPTGCDAKPTTAPVLSPRDAR